jgi:hypothetical protein
MTKGRMGRAGLRWRVVFGSAPAAHFLLLPLGCSNSVRSLFGKPAHPPSPPATRSSFCRRLVRRRDRPRNRRSARRARHRAIAAVEGKAVVYQVFIEHGMSGAITARRMLPRQPQNKSSNCIGEPLRTGSALDPCQYFGMIKKKDPIETAMTTISSVKREMQKPRSTEPVRNDGRNQAAPLAEKPPAR